jgi:hypothetical protein
LVFIGQADGQNYLQKTAQTVGWPHPEGEQKGMKATIPMQIGTSFPWFASVSKKRSWGANPGGRQSAKVRAADCARGVVFGRVSAPEKWQH